MLRSRRHDHFSHRRISRVENVVEALLQELRRLFDTSFGNRKNPLEIRSDIQETSSKYFLTSPAMVEEKLEATSEGFRITVFPKI